MFNITQGKGFFIEFENGYGISVQFGWGNYCANKETTTFPKDFVAEQVRCGQKGSVDAEIAVLDPEGHLVGQALGIFKDDDVEGWVSPERVLEVMNFIAGIQLPVKATDEVNIVCGLIDEVQDEEDQMEYERTFVPE